MVRLLRQYFRRLGWGVKTLTDARLQAKEAWISTDLYLGTNDPHPHLLDLGQHEQAVAEGIRAVEDAPGHVRPESPLRVALTTPAWRT